MGIRITSWNVNGIRNPFGYQPWSKYKTFTSMFDILRADIIVMQELKIQKKDLRDDMVLLPGWDCYFSLPKHKNGYSGVGIYTRQSVCAPIRAEEGLTGVLCRPGSSTPYRDLPDDACIGGYPTSFQITELEVEAEKLDSEGRCVVLEFPAFVLFGVYIPANSSGKQEGFRRSFFTSLDIRIRNLEKMGKRVILTGDLNVSRDKELDTARCDETREEYYNGINRRLFHHLLEAGTVLGERDEGREKPVLWDTCRGFHPTRLGMYTHWQQKLNARPGNHGSRIDYVLCSIEMKTWFSDSNIQEGLMGSDHCPVYATIKDEVDVRGETVKILDIMNPPGMFKGGMRLREYCTKDIPAFSGKLLKEFDKRRTIKDMFSRKPSLPSRKSSLGVSADPSANIDTPTSSMPEASLDQGESEAAFSTTTRVPSPEKRRAKEPPIPLPANKSQRIHSSSTTPAASGAPTSSKGQQSLKGFFQPKAASIKTNGTSSQTDSTRVHSAPPNTADIRPASTPPVSKTNDSRDGPIPRSPSVDNTLSDPPFEFPLQSQTSVRRNSYISEQSEEKFIDPIVSKESWNKLFTKKPPPRCEGHGEGCIILKTKKPGMNCGRDFYICRRPIGPSGQRETGTEWRCGTFIWASDWASPRAKA